MKKHIIPPLHIDSMQLSKLSFGAVLVSIGLLFVPVAGASIAVGPTSQVENSTTANINIIINDSSHGTDRVTTEIKIQSNTSDPVSSNPVPSNLQRFTGTDDTIGNLDVLAAVQAANKGTQIGGQPVDNLDVLNVVQYANSP
jgi:hypothetical protein